MYIDIGEKMVEVRLEIDETCEQCKEALVTMVRYRNNLYPTRLSKGRMLVVRPDVNAAGIVTHYHFEINENQKIS
jgi:hypothetical protein